MAHVVLGLLMLWPQSLYELTKSFEAGVSLFYSSSTGSIKRALDRLLADGSIMIESEGGPRGKRIYGVTEVGRAEFQRWMTADIHLGNPETSTLARVYFLGLLSPEDRLLVAALVRERIQAGLDDLERIEAQLASAEVPPEHASIARYQLATLQYGLSSYRAAQIWADRHLPHQ